MKGKILKFSITPICLFIDDNGEPVGEKVVKEITHYSGNTLDLKKLQQELEDTINGNLSNFTKT